jgi:CRP-like cAMP-binding protein
MEKTVAGLRKYNHLLGQLTEAEFSLMSTVFEVVSLRKNQILSQPSLHTAFLYFVITGFISSFVIMRDGSSAEAFLIGREGCTNLGALSSAIPAAHETVVQSDSRALRVHANVVRSVMSQNEHARAVLYHYLITQLHVSTQMTACNALHSVRQRLAQRLLILADRIGADTVEITHEQLSRMLGTKRTTISVILKEFENRHLIGCDYGKLHILRRNSLEHISCECYAHIRALENLTDPKAVLVAAERKCLQGDNL